MFVLELVLLFIGLMISSFYFWLQEIVPQLPIYAQQFLTGDSPMFFIGPIAVYAGYIGVILLAVNLVIGNRKWWLSRISAAMWIVMVLTNFRVW